VEKEKKKKQRRKGKEREVDSSNMVGGEKGKLTKEKEA